MTDDEWNGHEYNRPRFLLHNRRHICAVLSNGEHHILPYEKNTRLSEIFDISCQLLNLSNVEREIFGLAVIIDEFYHFLDINVKISSIHFKSIRKKTNITLSKSISSLNISSQSLTLEDDMPLVYFRLKFYVQCNTLRERSTKHCYYRQLKSNYLAYKLLISDELIFQLGALALQSEFGPYKFMKPEQKNNYFNPLKFFPAWFVEKYGESYIRKHLPNLHRQHEYLGRAEAEFQFIRLASQPSSNFNMHLCRMVDHTTFKKSDTVLWLGVSPMGFEMFEERMTFLSHTSTLLWNQVSQFTYKKRKFIVSAQGGNTLVLRGSSATQIEHLFWLCGQMHRYQTTAQLAALQSLEAIEERDRKKFRESYVFSDSKDLELRQRSESAASSLSLHRPIKAHQLHNHIASEMSETAGYSGYNSLPTRKSLGAAIIMNQNGEKLTDSVKRRVEEMAMGHVQKETMSAADSSLDQTSSYIESSTPEHRHARDSSIDKITDSGRHSSSSMSIPQPLSTSSPVVETQGTSLDLSTSLVLPPPHQFSSVSVNPPPDTKRATSISSIQEDSSMLISPPPDFQSQPSWSVQPEETDIDGEVSPLRPFSLSSPAQFSAERFNDRKSLSPSGALLSGRGMSVSLDSVNYSSGINLDQRGMSRSFPLLVNLCREFNETSILSSVCSQNNIPQLDYTERTYERKPNYCRDVKSNGKFNSAATKSWRSETLHLDQIGNSSDDDYDDIAESSGLNGCLHFTDNVTFSSRSSSASAANSMTEIEELPSQFNNSNEQHGGLSRNNNLRDSPNSSSSSVDDYGSVDYHLNNNNSHHHQFILEQKGKTNNTQAYNYA